MSKIMGRLVCISLDPKQPEQCDRLPTSGCLVDIPVDGQVTVSRVKALLYREAARLPSSCDFSTEEYFKAVDHMDIFHNLHWHATVFLHLPAVPEDEANFGPVAWFLFERTD